MDSAALLSCLSTDGSALADAAEGHLDLPVGSCPEWTLAELVAHVGRVHGWVCATVAAGGERAGRTRRRPVPEDDGGAAAVVPSRRRASWWLPWP